MIAEILAADRKQELGLMHRFADALLRIPSDPYRAALQVFGTDTLRAMKAATDWPMNYDVLVEQARLIEEHGEEYFLPSKALLARRVYDAAETARDLEGKLKAYKLYAEIRGYVEKPGMSVNVNNTVNNNKVMIEVAHGNDNEWEEKARAQQAKLIAHARD